MKETILSSWNQPVRNGQRVAFVAEILRGCKKALSKWKRENNLNSRGMIVQL